MDEALITELWNRAVADTGDVLYPKIIARFAELIAAEEREACARTCEKTGDTTGECPEMAGYCADAIRMRSNARLTGAEPKAERPS